MELTRELSTKQLYLKRTKSFIQRAYREAKEQNHEILKQDPITHSFGKEEVIGLSLLNTAIWACRHWAKQINQRSWRNYRASIVFTAELYLETGEIDDDSYNRIITVLSKTKAANIKDLELKTSAKKQKSLPLKDLKIIDKELSKSKSMWATPTRLWLRAGILTGLRPIEWRNSELFENDDICYLIVKNAKNTNNRSNGEKRTLHLNHLNSDEISIIKNHMKLVGQFKESRNDWMGYYQGCSNLLKTKTRILFPNRKKYPTLYSTRHQFSANSKASGCLPNEIAALMGHASDLTAQMTYGKKINGTRGKKPEIEQNEISNVRSHKKTNKYFSFKDELTKIKNKKSK